jgi:hypothetical protein
MRCPQSLVSISVAGKNAANPSLQRTGQQRRCACCWPAAELWRWLERQASR